MGRLRMVKRWQVVAAGVVALVVAGAIVATVTNDTSAQGTLAVTEPARDAVAAPATAPPGLPGIAGSSANSADLAAGGQSGQKQIDVGPVPPTSVPGAVVPGALKIVRTGELRVDVGKNGFAVAFDRVAPPPTAGSSPARRHRRWTRPAPAS